MIPVDEARALVAGHASPLPSEAVPLRAAAGRMLAAPVFADRDDPPFAKALMDGYAARAADLPGKLTLVGRVEAGQAELEGVGPGEGAWINIGAPLPPMDEPAVKTRLRSRLYFFAAQSRKDSIRRVV